MSFGDLVLISNSDQKGKANKSSLVSLPLRTKFITIRRLMQPSEEKKAIRITAS